METQKLAVIHRRQHQGKGEGLERQGAWDQEKEGLPRERLKEGKQKTAVCRWSRAPLELWGEEMGEG